MGTAAGNLDRSLGVLATLTAVFLILWNGTLASGMRAFLFLGLGHGENTLS
jgi:hypothetical protein